MMQMTREYHVPDLLWVVKKICHEFARIEDGWQVGFLHCKLLLLNGRYNGLREWLRILLLNQSLYLLAVYLLRSGIILLVFMENNRI